MLVLAELPRHESPGPRRRLPVDPRRRIAISVATQLMQLRAGADSTPRARTRRIAARLRSATTQSIGRNGDRAGRMQIPRPPREPQRTQQARRQHGHDCAPSLTGSSVERIAHYSVGGRDHTAHLRPSGSNPSGNTGAYSTRQRRARIVAKSERRRLLTTEKRPRSGLDARRQWTIRRTTSALASQARAATAPPEFATGRQTPAGSDQMPATAKTAVNKIRT